MTINLDDTLNETEEVIINKKVFKIRELTFRERDEIMKILTAAYNKINELKNDPDALMKALTTKDDMDLGFLVKLFSICGSAQTFIQEDLDCLTNTAYKKLMEVIYRRNNFLGPQNLMGGAPEGPK